MTKPQTYQTSGSGNGQNRDRQRNEGKGGPEPLSGSKKAKIRKQDGNFNPEG
ncbi:small acid-soluble spore protein P [Paenibacillus sp. MBLB2552]|uniref:Small acid-soluble spore protein P n=1 Tax=Paenibacillus mellifer TaxID=2937794 RepID=A0A9X2BST1_9BACL|nr:small acid-soluble spore protein P [Paenibacillus mellifer]MCK8490172.1 small acid-soluble spore protein P [Paenibacillus mellifer]